MSLLRSRDLPAAVAAAAIVAFLSVSCGGGSSPSHPTTPSPTPTPQTSPTPPGGGVGSTSCPLGKGTVGAACAKGTSRLIDAVFAAMDTLVQTKPQIFDKTQETGTGTGQYLVLDKEAYLNGLVSILVASGYCSERDPEDFNYERILVKNENGFSETFDVITGSGYMRKNGTYRETCTPASFPVDRGTEVPPAGSGCGQPYPPPISRFRVKVHVPGDVDLLDSTPLVGPDAAYCASIGYTDGRDLCPVRIEGSPERIPCETFVVGYAADTGRPGPTWTREPEGTLCTGPASGCVNHETNQYALYVYRGGTYRATGRTGAWGQVYVDKPQ